MDKTKIKSSKHEAKEQWGEDSFWDDFFASYDIVPHNDFTPLDEAVPAPHAAEEEGYAS